MTSVVVELIPGTRMVESLKPRKEITFRGHSVIMWLRSKMKILKRKDLAKLRFVFSFQKPCFSRVSRMKPVF